LMVPTHCFAQWYVGAYGGVAIPHESDFELTIPSIAPGVVFIGETDFDPGPMAGGRVGYWMEALDLPFFGVEAEFYWAGPESGDLTLLTSGFNVLARYPYGPVQPYAGAGVGVIYADVDGIDDDDTNAALQLMGGLRGFVTDNVALFAEYKWVLTEFEFDGPSGSTLEFDYSTSHVFGGIEYHFGTGGVHQKP